MRQPEVSRLPEQAASSELDNMVLVTAEDAVDQQGMSGTELYRGDGEVVNREAASRREPAVSEAGEIVLNFEGESIQSVVHTIRS
ncbi:hypothetical protein D3C83_78180 [compost metagenome]